MAFFVLYKTLNIRISVNFSPKIFYYLFLRPPWFTNVPVVYWWLLHINIMYSSQCHTQTHTSFLAILVRSSFALVLCSTGQHWTICSNCKCWRCFHWKSNKQQPVPKENISGGEPSHPPSHTTCTRQRDPVRNRAELGGRGRR